MTEITLINRRSDKIKITRGTVPAVAPEIRALEQQIGYVKVPILVKGQAEAVKKGITESIKKGAQRIILDLRGSAGGELKEGIEVANLFLKSGTIAKVIGRKDKILAQHDAKPESAITDLPLVVIVDRTTAGASEVVAAAILENQRGEIVGERTLFGMGGEQELFPLDDGSALLLTTARYASPSGKILMAEGVSPTVEVKRIDIPELQATDDNEPEPNQPRTPATDQPRETPPPIVVPPKPTEDLTLKKAIEVVLSGNKAKKRAA